MEQPELEAVIEAILFTMGEAVELERIAAAAGRGKEDCRRAVCHLAEQYSQKGHGIQIIELDGAFQMCTKKSMYGAVAKIAHIPKKYVLTDVLLETLSIIAYKQPVTKLEIEHIRGVKSDHPINKLMEYGLICEAGRLDAPGKPILFATTEEFLRNFGMESLENLPVVQPEKVEDFKQEAEAEALLEKN